MISTRGQRNASFNDMNGFPREESRAFHKIDHPTGDVDFSHALNYLMYEEMFQYIQTQKSMYTAQDLTYGEGPIGNKRLLDAMASHLNETFHPVIQITNMNIIFSAGVTSLNDMCATNLADEGDALLLGMPIYGAFDIDMTMTTGCKLIYTPFHGDDQFSPGAVARYEEAFIEARDSGIKVKVLVICNPHNPLGRCYPPETLKALFYFCAKYNIHLVSDEIYAHSVFNTPSKVQPPSFTSVLSIDTTEIINPELIHVLYGMSKDFCAAGLRLGCLITHNQKLAKASRTLFRFRWPSEFTSAIATRILEDRHFKTAFLKKSQKVLGENYALAIGILDKAGISYSKGGNAGFFLWIDLSPYLRPSSSGNLWDAEKALREDFEKAGVIISSGKGYHEERPGWFRVVFSLEKELFQEGLRRIIDVCQRG